MYNSINKKYYMANLGKILYVKYFCGYFFDFT